MYEDSFRHCRYEFDHRACPRHSYKFVHFEIFIKFSRFVMELAREKLSYWASFEVIVYGEYIAIFLFISVTLRWV